MFRVASLIGSAVRDAKQPERGIGWTEGNKVCIGRCILPGFREVVSLRFVLPYTDSRPLLREIAIWIGKHHGAAIDRLLNCDANV